MKREKGNILLIILIAILLYGLLTYAMSNTDGGSEFNTDTEQFKAEMGEMYNYANAIHQAVQKLRTINGCEDNDIDFYMAGVTDGGYQHAQENPRCKVFHPKGGGVSFMDATETIGDTSITGNFYRFIGDQSIEGVGTTRSELMFSALVTQQACIQANRHLGITNPGGVPPSSANVTLTTNHYFNGGNTATGDYEDGTSIISEANLEGQTSGCVYDSVGGVHSYYHVLIAR